MSALLSALDNGEISTAHAVAAMSWIAAMVPMARRRAMLDHIGDVDADLSDDDHRCTRDLIQVVFEAAGETVEAPETVGRGDSMDISDLVLSASADESRKNEEAMLRMLIHDILGVMQPDDPRSITAIRCYRDGAKNWYEVDIADWTLHFAFYPDEPPNRRVVASQMEDTAWDLIDIDDPNLRSMLYHAALAQRGL